MRAQLGSGRLALLPHRGSLHVSRLVGDGIALEHIAWAGDAMYRWCVHLESRLSTCRSCDGAGCSGSAWGEAANLSDVRAASLDAGRLAAEEFVGDARLFWSGHIDASELLRRAQRRWHSGGEDVATCVDGGSTER